MNTITLILQIILFIWFFGCICTYKIGKHTLVDGEGVKSIEFIMLCCFTSGVVLNQLFPKVGKWWLLFVLVFWITAQFFCHWYYTIFGASEKKLKGYNECFAHTVRLIPASDTRLIPDLYHTVLHLLIIANIVLLLC